MLFSWTVECHTHRALDMAIRTVAGFTTEIDARRYCQWRNATCKDSERFVVAGVSL